MNKECVMECSHKGNCDLHDEQGMFQDSRRMYTKTQTLLSRPLSSGLVVQSGKDYVI